MGNYQEGKVIFDNCFNHDCRNLLLKFSYEYLLNINNYYSNQIYLFFISISSRGAIQGNQLYI